jgi:antitoxin (DNA-binding transcriptional repressor) of toxin-antitoxin stability system
MQVSIRELKANPTRAITLVQQGEVVHITSHRKVVAELVQPQTLTTPKVPLTDAEVIQRLFDAGVISNLPKKPLRLGPPIVFAPGPDGQTMSELVLEMRGPR